MMRMMKIFHVPLLRDKSECSPKFIVTLDGVPSPLASLTDHDMDSDHALSTMAIDSPAEQRLKPVHFSMTSDRSYSGEGTDTKTKTRLVEHVM